MPHKPIVLLPLVVALACGCEPRASDKSDLQLSVSVESRPIERELVVLRVQRGDQFFAGLPHDERTAVTAAGPLRAASGPVAVQGHDVRMQTRAGRDIEEQPALSEHWVRLTGPSVEYAFSFDLVLGEEARVNLVDTGGKIRKYEPNRFAERWQPRPGERVRVGGFLLPKSGDADVNPLTPEEFGVFVPDYVEGTVLGGWWAATPAAHDSLLVKVPEGDYRGFVGGPAAIVESGEPLVVGIVLAVHERFAGERMYLLEVGRLLPPE